MERSRARIAGFFYLLVFLTGGLVAVAANRSLPLLGFAGYVLNVACYVVVTQMFYDLFRPVNASISLLAAFSSLVGCAVQATACLFQLGAPQPRLHAQGYDVGLVFFGFYCLLIGYLIFRSTFLPRALGALMAFAGLGWLTFLSPPFAHSLDPYIRIPGVLGEGSLTLWLLIKSTSAPRPD
jgi:hypothetical protein